MVSGARRRQPPNRAAPGHPFGSPNCSRGTARNPRHSPARTAGDLEVGVPATFSASRVRCARLRRPCDSGRLPGKAAGRTSGASPRRPWSKAGRCAVSKIGDQVTQSGVHDQQQDGRSVLLIVVRGRCAGRSGARLRAASGLALRGSWVDLVGPW